MIYILLYIITILLQYKLQRNTTKNFFNKECPSLQWNNSNTKALKNKLIITSLILPLIGLIPLILIYPIKYWTFRSIKMLNP